MATVLLVDDEDLVRKVVRVVLEAEGHEVDEAADGPSALGVLDSGSPDAVVLDLLIPGADGYELCRKIKAASPATRVLVLTSVPAEESESKARSAGADDVMTKPFSALDLLGRLSAMLS